jgi:hypothetical protein
LQRHKGAGARAAAVQVGLQVQCLDSVHRVQLLCGTQMAAGRPSQRADSQHLRNCAARSPAPAPGTCLCGGPPRQCAAAPARCGHAVPGSGTTRARLTTAARPESQGTGWGVLQLAAAAGSMPALSHGQLAERLQHARTQPPHLAAWR